MKKLILIFQNQPMLVKQFELEYEIAIETNNIKRIKELDALLLFSIRTLLYEQQTDSSFSFNNIWFD